MARRRFQAGQLIDDGDRWCARWREDVIVNGEIKRVRKWDVIASKKTCPTRRMAQRQLEERLREVNREDYSPTPVELFGTFADTWKKNVMVHHKPSTQRAERSVIGVHLIPTFGALVLRDINAEMLQTWVTAHKSSAKTVRNLVATFRSMWTTACDWGYVRHDPFKGLKLPTFATGNTYQFSVEETLKIIDRARGWKKTFLRILAETGMRPGELAGLRRQDLQGRVIVIRQAVWQRQVQTPKTKTATRKFALSVALAEELKVHIEQSKPNTLGLVFTATSGRPLSMDNFRHRVLDPILKELGIETDKRCGLYAFRHMNATLMDSLGTPLKTRQNRLGHADPSVTISHYTHAVDADDVAASDQIGALLNPEKDEAVQ